MATTHTLSGNVSDLVGTASLSFLRVSVEASEDVLTDTDLNETRLGAFEVDVDEVTGAWSVVVPDTSDPAWVPSPFFIRVVVEFRDNTRGSYIKTERSNWFELTADTPFSAVVSATSQRVSAQLLVSISERIAAAEAALDAAELVIVEAGEAVDDVEDAVDDAHDAMAALILLTGNGTVGLALDDDGQPYYDPDLVANNTPPTLALLIDDDGVPFYVGA